MVFILICFLQGAEQQSEQYPKPKSLLQSILKSLLQPVSLIGCPLPPSRQPDHQSQSFPVVTSPFQYSAEQRPVSSSRHAVPDSLVAVFPPQPRPLPHLNTPVLVLTWYSPSHPGSWAGDPTSRSTYSGSWAGTYDPKPGADDPSAGQDISGSKFIRSWVRRS